jgi:hypothetical protein
MTATATSVFSCLGHLGRRDTDRIVSICVTPPKVAKARLSHVTVAGVIALTFANGNTAYPISVALPKVCQGKYSSVAVTGVITGIIGGVIADVIANKCCQFEYSLNEKCQ